MTDRAPNVRTQVFLVLFPAAVGCLLGTLVIDPGFVQRSFGISALTVTLLFAVAGTVVPVLGMRRPLRAYRLLRRVGGSALSRQALLVGLFTVLFVIHWALALAGRGTFALGVVAAGVGCGAVVASGLTYRLSSQPGWRHWSTPVSLLGGLLLVGGGATLLMALVWPQGLGADTAGIRAARTLAIVGGGALMLALVGRASYLSRGGRRTEEIWALTRERHRWEHFGAAVLVVVSTAATVVAFAWTWSIILAFVAAMAAEFVQWRLFFVTGIPSNWKGEIHWALPPNLGDVEGVTNG
ncbi:MAG: dimethyl sulfoxide reductase anchor subunit [Actinobacteria bacterium]|nr:dimethyl sulfoxide reductase anchor subunit [Actinomycetota bacterium]